MAVPRHVHHIAPMAELEAALISERVTAGMKAAGARGQRFGRPPVARPIVSEIETLAASTTLSIREIQKKIVGKASLGVVEEKLPNAFAPCPQPPCDHFLHVF